MTRDIGEVIAGERHATAAYLRRVAHAAEEQARRAVPASMRETQLRATATALRVCARAIQAGRHWQGGAP